MKIKDLGKCVTGRTPSSKNPTFYGGEIPFIRIPDLGDGRFIGTVEKTLTAEGLKAVHKAALPKGSVMVSCIATIGKVGITHESVSVTNQQINSIIPNNEIVDTEWLYYFFKDLGEDLAVFGGGGSVFEIISKSKFQDIEIDLPNRSIQEAIAEVLSSLDDKIDLLKRQNKTLEGMAEALFRQWFIEEAQDDWEEVELSDYLDFGSGFPFKSKSYLDHGNYRVATIKHVQDGFLDISDSPFLQSLPPKIKPHCILAVGDVILSLTGNVGRCCIVDEDKVLLNQRVATILPHVPEQLAFWYFFFRYPSTKLLLDQLSHGTAQKNLSTRVLLKEQFLLPPSDKIGEMIPVFKDCFEKLLKNFKVSENLISQRDTLLPKLMSGEVRVQMD